MARRAEQQLRPATGARALPAAIAVVLVAHAVLLLALARQGSAVASTRASPRGARWIVLLDSKRDGAPPGMAAPAPARTAEARDDPSPTRVVAAGAEHPPRPPSRSGAKPPADGTAAIGIYRAATTLDVPARARSAPDITVLAGLPWSGLPLRMRLFIDAQGAVVDARILRSSESDEVVARVRGMFLATGFTAGVQDGHPVPSYKDIELTIATPS